MSDIPPELLDPKPVPKLKAFSKRKPSFLRESWHLILLIIVLLLLWPYVSHAATYDTSQTYCELFAQDPENGRFYIVEDPPWTPACAHPWVTVNAAKFLALVQAYEGGTGNGGPDPVGQFTSAEIEALKAYALTGMKLHIEPKPMDPEFTSDLSLLTGTAMGALAVIFTGRKLLSFFNHSPKE